MHIQSNESSGAAKRRNLFELFAGNLNAVKQHPNVRMEPEFSEGYICPICFKLFGRNSLSLEYLDHLTLEDIPPQALGGNVATLTCKICNNRDGTELDSHLVKMLRSDAFFSGVPGIKLDALFQPDLSVALPATVKFLQGNTFDIRYHENRSDPKEIDRLHNLEETGSISSIKLSFLLGYKINRPEVALIRIAYLLAFARFGYGFLMNPNLLTIRHQIMNPSETLLPDWGILKEELPDSSAGVNIICEPQNLKSFLVVFDVKLDKVPSRYGVILPGPSSPGLDVYKQIVKYKKMKSNIAIEHKLKVIPEDDYLRNQNLAFASHWYWNEICK